MVQGIVGKVMSVMVTFVDERVGLGMANEP